MKGSGHLGPMITLRPAPGSPSRAAPQSAGLAWTPCSPLLGDSGCGWVEGMSLLGQVHEARGWGSEVGVGCEFLELCDAVWMSLIPRFSSGISFSATC